MRVSSLAAAATESCRRMAEETRRQDEERRRTDEDKVRWKDEEIQRQEERARANTEDGGGDSMVPREEVQRWMGQEQVRVGEEARQSSVWEFREMKEKKRNEEQAGETQAGQQVAVAGLGRGGEGWGGGGHRGSGAGAPSIAGIREVRVMPRPLIYVG